MKTNAEQNAEAKTSHFAQSTYAMVLRAEDRRRNVLEMAVYGCMMVSLLATGLALAQPILSADTKPSEQKPIVATATSL